jgi:hypothetical protein
MTQRMVMRAIDRAVLSRLAAVPTPIEDKGAAFISLIAPSTMRTKSPTIHGPLPCLLPLSQSRYIIAK